MQRFGSPSSMASAESRPYDSFVARDIEVPVKVRTSEFEEKTAWLRLGIALAQVPGTHHYSLQIVLTEESDPFFLFSFECDEGVFHSLKQEQAILVDFVTFPHKIIELLEMCCRRTEEGPRFICVLEKQGEMQGTLNVVETNLFKQLVHLSLKLRGGNDEVVKTHLAAKLRELKGYTEGLEGKFAHTADSLELKTEQLEDLSREFRRLQDEFERKISENRLEEQEKLAFTRQQLLQEQFTLKKAHEEEKRALAEKLEGSLRDLQNKLEISSTQVSELTSTKYSLEGRERELATRLRQADHQVELANNELEHLRETSKNFTANNHAQDRKLTELTLSLANLERQLKDKEDIIGRLTDLTETNSDYRAQQEETLNMLKATVGKLEDKLQQSAAEINKGNSIIQKLQADVKSGKQKLKLKNTVILQQEQVIQQKREINETQNKENLQLKRDFERKHDDNKDLENTVSELKNKLAEASNTLQSNSSTIQ